MKSDPDFVNNEWLKEEIKLCLHGLDSNTDEHIDWFKHEMSVGDEITVRILSEGESDIPIRRSRSKCGVPSTEKDSEESS